MIKMTCTNCGTEFLKEERFAKEERNYFCTSSCSVSYNNKRREVGHKRSKVELWVEPRLKEFYPDLEIWFNRKQAIESELDIYIPSLKLAIELNGGFHYFPIFGESLLKATQANDKEKADKCKERGIELITIDVTDIKFLTKKRGYKLLRQIASEIDKRKGKNNEG